MNNKDTDAGLNREMIADFHIFASTGEQRFTVQQTELAAAREFSSLVEAAQHLRREQPENNGWIVVHDEEGLINRIPLRMSV